MIWSDSWPKVFDQASRALRLTSAPTLSMSRTVSNDFGGTWGEFGIGANVSVSDSTYVYADVEHTTGGEIEELWRVNFGVRYNF